MALAKETKTFDNKNHDQVEWSVEQLVREYEKNEPVVSQQIRTDVFTLARTVVYSVLGKLHQRLQSALDALPSVLFPFQVTVDIGCAPVHCDSPLFLSSYPSFKEWIRKFERAPTQFDKYSIQFVERVYRQVNDLLNGWVKGQGKILNWKQHDIQRSHNKFSLSFSFWIEHSYTKDYNDELFQGYQPNL